MTIRTHFSHNYLLLAAAISMLLLNGCGQEPVYDLGGNQLPDIGSKAAIIDNSEPAHVGKDAETMRDFAKLADIPENQKQAASQKALAGDSYGYNEFMSQALATEAKHLIASGRMYVLESGTSVRIRTYYKLGVMPFNIDTSRTAAYAEIEILSGKHAGETGIVSSGHLH